MKIRFPNPGDRDVIQPLARKMHTEGWFRDFDFDPAKVDQLFNECLNNPDYLALVAEDAGEVVGFFVAVAVAHFFGADRYACDLVLYVDPSHRGGTSALRMLRMYQTWGDEKGLKELHLGVSTDITPERTGALYKALGFESHIQGYRKKCV